MADNLIQVTECPFICDYKTFADQNGKSWIFIGQIQKYNKKIKDSYNGPCGFVRQISGIGNSISEGMYKSKNRNGWGRFINHSGQCWIGWWKDGVLCGNCKEYKVNGQLKQEGWYENGQLKG